MHGVWEFDNDEVLMWEVLLEPQTLSWNFNMK